MIQGIASHRPVHTAPEYHPHTVNVFTANKQGCLKAVQNALTSFLFYYLNRSRGLERCLRRCLQWGLSLVTSTLPNSSEQPVTQTPGDLVSSSGFHGSSTHMPLPSPTYCVSGEGENFLINCIKVLYFILARLKKIVFN